MEKIIHPAEHEELLQKCGGTIAQYFFEGDRVKSAASDVFTRAKMAELAPPKGKFGVHLVGIGSEEYYGPNRNGDSFPEKALLKYGNTFMTHGSFYRNHKNRGPKHSIGDIKAAEYNPALHRTELFVWGDCEKAPKEYARAKEAKNSSFSMSCTVPWDRCNCCSKKAATTASYCDDLKRFMLQWRPSFGKYAFAINDEPKFFDISDVTDTSPADRIAHHLEYVLPAEQLAKAASVSVVNGHDRAIAEGVSLPTGSPLDPALIKLAAEIKATYLQASADKGELGRAQRIVKQAAASAGELNPVKIEALRRLSPGTLVRELSKRAMLLPFNTFCVWLTGAADDTNIKAAASRLDESIDLALATFGESNGLEGVFEPATKFAAELDPGNTDVVERIMDGAGEQFGVSPTPVTARAVQTIARPGPVEEAPNTCVQISIKTSAEGISPELLLASYGLYKLASHRAIRTFNPGLDRQFLDLQCA